MKKPERKILGLSVRTNPIPKTLLITLYCVVILNRRFIVSVVENLASEQAARMVAMKAATDNGGNSD